MIVGFNERTKRREEKLQSMLEKCGRDSVVVNSPNSQSGGTGLIHRLHSLCAGLTTPAILLESTNGYMLRLHGVNGSVLMNDSNNIARHFGPLQIMSLSWTFIEEESIRITLIGGAKSFEHTSLVTTQEDERYSFQQISL